MGIEAAYSTVVILEIGGRIGFTEVVVWEEMLLVSKSIPLIPVQCEGVSVQTKSILNVNCVLKNVVWVNRVLAVYPGGDVVSPLRNIFSLNHFALLGPFGVMDDPLPVDHGGIIPITLKRYNLQRKV